MDRQQLFDFGGAFSTATIPITGVSEGLTLGLSNMINVFKYTHFCCHNHSQHLLISSSIVITVTISTTISEKDLYLTLFMPHYFLQNWGLGSFLGSIYRCQERPMTAATALIGSLQHKKFCSCETSCFCYTHSQRLLVTYWFGKESSYFDSNAWSIYISTLATHKWLS